MRLTVGLLTHNSEKFAARCLETLVAQTELGTPGTDWQIICLDNASSDRIALARLEQAFPQVRFIKEHTNHGFARAHNRIMRTFPADFHAILNIDVFFAPDYLAKLIEALEAFPQAGSAVGKLLRWNIGRQEERTNIIDSAGIQATTSHAFSDRGQGEKDRGQYDEPCEVFGGTGAAIVYRRSALEEIAYCHAERSPERAERVKGADEAYEFLDETMFMYKEDIDLAYRLLFAGHPCRYVPEARAWHARGTGKGLSRWKRPALERTLSSTHETLLLRKHQSLWPEDIRRRTRLRQIARGLYLLVLEPRVFIRSRKLLRSLQCEAEKRKRDTKHTVPFAAIAHFFN